MALHLAIQTDIMATIARPDFNAAFPPLSENAWLHILSFPKTGQFYEKGQLEFLGDAMMDAALARQIYKLVPEGSAGFYTVCTLLLHTRH